MQPEAAKVHTVFSAECNPTFDWHSIALFHSHKTSGQPGGITRLLACNDDELATYHGVSIGQPLGLTFVHRNHRREFGMNYAAYNKPASVYYWTRSGQVPPAVELHRPTPTPNPPPSPSLRTAHRSPLTSHLSPSNPNPNPNP